MSNGVREPKNYRKKTRLRRREENIRLARALNKVSRHTQDPEGSDHWVETGRWPTPQSRT